MRQCALLCILPGLLWEQLFHIISQRAFSARNDYEFKSINKLSGYQSNRISSAVLFGCLNDDCSETSEGVRSVVQQRAWEDNKIPEIWRPLTCRGQNTSRKHLDKTSSLPQNKAQLFQYEYRASKSQKYPQQESVNVPFHQLNLSKSTGIKLHFILLLHKIKTTLFHDIYWMSCHSVIFRSHLSPLPKHRKLLLKEKYLEERPQTGQRAGSQQLLKLPLSGRGRILAS